MKLINTLGTIFTILALLVAVPSEPIDSVELPLVDIVASVKVSEGDEGAYSATTLGTDELEGLRIASVKELSAIAPNFYQPDYGSRMTSSMYVRGFGSRIDQPVVGMNIDEVPLLNKNCYDFELFDIARVQVLRGAQSALYGRNTSGGAINVYTLSPLNFQGKRLALEYGNGNSIRLKASHYAKYGDTFGWSAGVHYSHSDGFFMNKELGENCDGGDNAAVRLRLQWLPSNRWSIDNSLSVGYTNEGGWAYGAYDTATGELSPVAYNHPCTYSRFTLSEGLVAKRYFEHATLSSATGYRYMDDRMHIDNDFLPLDYFTLGQYQKEHAVTQEFVVKSYDTGLFNFMGGVFCFFKSNKMSAPVHFKQYGIENLILKHIRPIYSYPGEEFSLEEDNFVIHDNFSIPAYGVAAHFQAGFSWKGLDVKAGLRVDYERSTMDYDCRATVHYKTLAAATEYRELVSEFVGRNSVGALELLPSFSLSYGGDWGNFYLSARRGFKAGGFNTQLFSDILQSKMSDELIGNTPDVDASSTMYKPETNWTYELGTHLSPLADGSLSIAAALFYIDCRNQQLTVFPKGMSTGRMMSNAGESYSMGGELTVNYNVGRLAFDVAAGYTYAKFKEYKSGKNDYSDKFLPFAPRETIAVNALYNIPVPSSFADELSVRIGWNAVGRIYWNEENSLSQAFYGLWQASAAWEKGVFGASLWAKNILNEQYKTFYFRSIGNDFFALGKPLQIGISLNVNL